MSIMGHGKMPQKKPKSGLFLNTVNNNWQIDSTQKQVIGSRQLFLKIEAHCWSVESWSVTIYRFESGKNVNKQQFFVFLLVNKWQTLHITETEILS